MEGVDQVLQYDKDTHRGGNPSTKNCMITLSNADKSSCSSSDRNSSCPGNNNYNRDMTPCCNSDAAVCPDNVDLNLNGRPVQPQLTL